MTNQIIIVNTVMAMRKLSVILAQIILSFGTG